MKKLNPFCSGTQWIRRRLHFFPLPKRWRPRLRRSFSHLPVQTVSRWCSFQHIWQHVKNKCFQCFPGMFSSSHLTQKSIAEMLNNWLSRRPNVLRRKWRTECFTEEVDNSNNNHSNKCSNNNDNDNRAGRDMKRDVGWVQLDTTVSGWAKSTNMFSFNDLLKIWVGFALLGHLVGRHRIPQ